MSANNLSIGIDFDNTIVCYDDIFHQVASERGLIPAGTPKNKESVRDYLRQAGKEDVWTEMQGYVYGARMVDVAAFPGALECIAQLKADGIPVFIISHKTRFPYKGERFDLQAAARKWLGNHGVSLDHVFFLETKEKKMAQIARCGCTHFIDDLPEFLAEPDFPKNVKKLLFSPTRTWTSFGKSDMRVFSAWKEIEEFLRSQYIEGEEALDPDIRRLLSGINVLRIERLPAGGNNRLYLVKTSQGEFVAKHYFTHPGDKRDRLHAEYAFTSFAAQHGIVVLPKPVACDPAKHLAIYSYIAGRRPEQADITPVAVKAALDFLLQLNRHRESAGKDLPLVSEACFSIAAHLVLIDGRVKRLFEVEDPEVKEFVVQKLAPAWERINAEVLVRTQVVGLDSGKELSQADRIISPSDFGFHNALLDDHGKFYFIDFEYAGWDDPAKTVGDFFSQPARPAPISQLECFSRTISELTPAPKRMLARICLLVPSYRIKWCCIVLNHFLPMENARRRFSGGDVEPAKAEQLIKAKGLLASIPEFIEVSHGIR